MYQAPNPRLTALLKQNKIIVTAQVGMVQLVTTTRALSQDVTD